MTAKVIITLQGAAGTTLIPVAAVVAGEGGQSTVWVYDEASGTVSSRAVTVGQMTGDEIEILEGLTRWRADHRDGLQQPQRGHESAPAGRIGGGA